MRVYCVIENQTAQVQIVMRKNLSRVYHVIGAFHLPIMLEDPHVLSGGIDCPEPRSVAVLLKKSKWLFSGRGELEKRLQLRRYAAKVCLSPKRTDSLRQRTIPAIIIDFPGSHS